ncbi:MAG: tetratricopeptide repeat protein [Sulfurimonas sp.]|nr:tetratricopeptide repeat protein [Sulfurimonas sp.]
MFKLFLSVLIAIFISGCAQKVKILSLEPAEIDRVATTKKITVASFKNDRVGVSGKIEANLAQHKIDGRSFFTIVSRNDFDKIISEQKIQNSGLIDTSTIVEVGQLIDAQAIILGNVGRISSQDSRFYETRTRCIDEKCKTREEYRVRCIKRVVGLSAELRIVDVAKGDIIYADKFFESSQHKHCSDDSNALPSKYMAAQNLATKIADGFTYKLTPHYRSFSVTLLEDADLDYTEDQEKLLELSLTYIEQGRYDKAEQFLIELIDSTDKQSYVPFYNLGVIKEAQGKYSEAKRYYKRADDLMIEPVQEISLASLRIEKLIRKHNKTKEQLQR